VVFSILGYSGYEGVVKNLMSELPVGSVSYSRPVSCVRWNNDDNNNNDATSSAGDQPPVSVEVEGGERIAADHVIVTVPLGALCHTCSVLWFCFRFRFWFCMRRVRTRMQPVALFGQ